MDKAGLLESLKEEINQKYGEEKAWFFPEYSGVKGFLGAQDIMFVGLNPSTGHFPSIYDKFFYKTLKENSFENAHITDAIKLKMPNKNVPAFVKNKDLLTEQFVYLDKEIKIIAPKMIIAMGNSCYNLLKEHYNSKILKIDHYHFPKRFGKENKYDSQMKAIKELYLKSK